MMTVIVNMGIKMTRIAGVAAGLLLAVGLAACNDDTGKSPADNASTDSSASQSSDGSATPSIDSSSVPADDDGKGTDGMTLTGTISSGVESGCVLLEQDGTTYNLVGGDREVLAEGAEVEVTGSVDEGLMTTCQQGTPFAVDTVKAL